MSKKDFAEIFTSLFNGNAGEAEQTAEDIVCDNFNIEEEWERQQQERLYYHIAKRHKVCYNNI